MKVVEVSHSHAVRQGKGFGGSVTGANSAVTGSLPEHLTVWGLPPQGEPLNTASGPKGRPPGHLGGKADAAALHADLQAVRRLAAGVHDAAVHVARAVTVIPHLVPAAAAARLRGADAARRLSQDEVAEGQELAEEAGQDAVHTAVCGSRRERRPGRGRDRKQTCQQRARRSRGGQPPGTRQRAVLAAPSSERDLVTIAGTL